MKVSSNFDLQAQYKKYQGVLKKAEKGKVVTRFAPEPSGYLHLGHVKACLITYHYAKMYEGQMILRFDDTNPSKEKQEYVDSIQEDLKKLGVEWSKISYTSDYFNYFEEKCEELIKNGLAYCDNTPVEEMRSQRDTGIESTCREQSVEENLRLWNCMKKAISPQALKDKITALQNPKKNDKKAKQKQEQQKQEDLTDYSAYCVRAKISMDNKNKCMRDPVLYRCNFTPHHRQGTKQVVYPTYDFACPLIDSMEGVTHAMRSMEYTDRVAQYEWVIKKCNVKPVHIFEFSRLNFVNIILSKRHLTWFVNSGRTDGWDDPRMPTVRGILRKGLTVETLTEFMLAQGASRKPSMMEWDKIWSDNKKIIDPVCPRFVSVRKERACKLTLTNLPENVTYNLAPWNPVKNSIPELKKQRPVAVSQNILLDYDDASHIKEGEKVTLVKLGNVTVKSIKTVGDHLELVGEHLPDDNDFKSTQKFTWLSADDDLVTVNLVELNHLITVPQMEEGMNIEDIANNETRFVNQFYAESLVRNLQVDQSIQFERRGYYRVDRVKQTKGGDKVLDLIYIPDGRTKAMTSYQTQAVKAEDLTKGSGGNNKKSQKQEQKNKGKGQQAASNLNLIAQNGNIQTTHIQIVSELASVQLNQNLVAQNQVQEQLKKLQQTDKHASLPALVTPEGNLYGASAICHYIALTSNKLYGGDDQDKNVIDQWLSYVNTDLNKALQPLQQSLFGQKQLEESEFQNQLQQVVSGPLSFLNTQLKGKKYLHGKNISLADVNLIVALVYPFRTYLNEQFRKDNQYLTSWFNNLSDNKTIVKYLRKNSYPKTNWN